MFGFKDIFLVVYVPVLLWLIGVIILFIHLLKKYTFGNWNEENPNPYQNETFGMPRGVMRGILTLSLLFVVMLLEVVALQVTAVEQYIDELLVGFQMMLAFYFGAKVMHHVTKADERKSKEMSAAIATARTTQNGGEFEDKEAIG